MRRYLLLAGALPGLFLFANTAYAGVQDYIVEPLNAGVRSGEAIPLAVRLIRKTDKSPVKDAIVFRSRLDMSPDGMEAMNSALTMLPARDGIYSFKANLPMAGKWALKLQVKIQGERETLNTITIFTAE